MIDFDVLPDWVFILLWGLSLAAVSYWHKQTLKRTQEGFPDLITLSRADTTVLEYNSAYQKLLGDWRGKRWIDSVPASEQALVREKLAQLTPDQPTVVCVNSLPDANGETRWFEWINQGLFDRRGRLQFIRGVGREITQQKQLEETLRMREAQLRTLLDALPLAVWARDSRGVLILQNATDRAWFGDLLGTSIEQAYEQNNWQDSHDKILAQINQQGVYQRESKELILGEERYTYRLTVPIRDQSEGLGVLGITLDMTEQKRLEQELKEQEARFHALIENSHDILHHMDAEGRLYCLNPKAAESILGYVPVPGEFRPLDWVHPQDQDKIAAAFEQLLAHPGQPLSFVYRMQHADGHWVWLESLATNWLADPVIQGIVSNTRDISRQKQVELDLQESERRLKAILDGIPFPIFLKDLQGRYTQVNATYLRLEKLSPDEILGKTDAELFLPDNALRYQREDQTALQSHQPISYEQVVPYPEQEITSLVTKFALRDGNGDPYALCGICVDITPLKTAQDVLLQEAERERLLGSLLQRSRQTLDLDQILQTTVAEVRQCLQVDRVMIYQLQELLGGVVIAESVQEPWPSQLGRSVWDAYFQADPCYRKYCQGFVQALGDVRAAHLDPCYQELLDSFQAQANLVVPIRENASEKLWGLLVAQHCQAPRFWEGWEIRLLQQLADQLAIALQQAQLYKQVQVLNQNLEEKIQQRTLELERSLQFEALLKRITDRVRDSLDEAEILSSAVQELGKNLQVDGCDIGLYNADLTRSTITYEYCPRVKSALNVSIPMVGGIYDDLYHQLTRGQSCLFCFISPTLVRPEKDHSVVFACPLTDKDHTLGDLWVFRRSGDGFDEQELRLIRQVANQCAIGLRQARLFRATQEQVLALERLNQLKDDFISTVSHELRTPLTSLRVALQMLQVTPPGKKHAQYLAIAQRECRREIELINDLLDLQRLEAGAYTLDIRTLTWEALLGDLLSITTEQTQSRGQQFEASVPLDGQISTDPTLLGRILRELLHNAVKYTPAQGSISLKVEPDVQQTCLQVSNSQEIPPEELPRIFERFYRIGNRNPWKEGGTGLGLALVKQIIDRLQGSLEVSSSAGWTTFTLWIPQVQEETTLG
ncbi:PAS domain S-box protein [Thermostichus vulcanus]|uniref:histidine kinase n=1 Tax=Thermostichus vulcanus str. 'Rupite' TaxID=2813851 RepID=A0ABT0CCU5_THEVL|nr:PAS domain S-box protein [Thermostichus vulcanus]MCJ2543605.1 PAS domain S-box protein [Thermostichus vulcanus str. 'Rupite']